VSSTAVIAAPPSGASIQSDRTRAAQLYARIQTVSGKVAYLGQQFDLAQLKVQAEEDIIVHTKEIVAQDAADVHTDQTQLRNVAMVAYVNAGETSGQNSLFSTNQATAGATSVYSNLAEGNLTEAVTALRSSSIELVDQRHILRHQVRIRQDAARAAQAELESAQSLRSELSSMEHSVNAQIQAYVAAAAAAATAQNEANWARTHPGNNYTGAYSNFPVPPPNSRANIAVRTALSYLGVPYVWGGASRSGVDCSGLVMLAWEAAGVDLPHYSGAQYADTVHIPLGDIQPGDLLFYGPGGDEHVAMYIGRGLMIEAPETGEVVHITPIRTGYGFAGVGRVE
jgi:cell wall-associated NlpC family hydrolase